MSRPSAPTHARATRTRNKRGEGAALRGELLDAASRLLEDTGRESALSLRSVARAAGVAAPSIYRHFADLRELVDGVLELRFAELASRIDQAAATSTSAAAELRARARAYCQFAVEHPGNYRVMFTAIPDVAETRRLDELPGARIVTDLADCIGRCHADGAAVPFAPLTAAILLWSALHGIVSLRVSKPAFPWPPVDELVDDALTAVCGLPRAAS